MIGPLTFHRKQQSDGSYEITVEDFLDEAVFSPVALVSEDHKLVRTFIEINVANGRAVYEVVSGDDPHMRITAKKITER